MDLYPAIDLRAGRCVRLHQGSFEEETIYGDDPVAVAKEMEAAGAPWLHVVDLDASRGSGSNREVVISIAAAVGIPVQTGGGVRDGSLLDAGVTRVVLGSMAIEEPDAVSALIAQHPGQVAVGLDHRDGDLRVRAWEASAGVQLLDAIGWPQLSGAAAFIVTNIARDGTLEGPDTEGLRMVAAATDVPVIASGGVGALEHLHALRSIGVAGVIVGKALYEGRFGVEEAVVACAR